MEHSLKSVISMIKEDRIVLPAMQRPFVWRADRITNLMDSLFRGFPIGMALLWKTQSTQRFRRFEKDVKPDIGITIDYDRGSASERYLVLDGQQRLTALYVSLAGTYDSKRMFVNVLSGVKGERDTSEAYWDCRFLTQAEATSLNEWPKTNAEKTRAPERALFTQIDELTRFRGGTLTRFMTNLAANLGLDDAQTERLSCSYDIGSRLLSNDRALQFHSIDEYSEEPTPMDEILEIFVRVNSAGLVLLKSDLLMSLLDIELDDIQQKIYRVVNVVNTARPFDITRDDVLKSLLIAIGADTRFANLIARSGELKELAMRVNELLPLATEAWRTLGIILIDDCKITSGRYLRSHNSLLPFIAFLMENPGPSPGERRRIVAGVYIALMTGIFSSAEARMGSFAKKHCKGVTTFPLETLGKLVANYYGVSSLENLLSRHLDLTLNIAHGGITLDNNPDNLERDHIFPRATLARENVPDDRTNHYANFHFLRGKDNRNKSDTPPDQWFRKPGLQPAYSDAELKVRLLRWELLEPGNFYNLLEERSRLISERACKLFGMEKSEIDNLLSS